MVRITIVSAAEGNLIHESKARCIIAQIYPTFQSVHQADSSSPLDVVEETTVTFTCNGHDFIFEGLVIKNLEVDVLAGIFFMEINNITIRPAKD